MSAAVDYGEDFPGAPNSIDDFDVQGWDDGDWDDSVWDGTNPAYSSYTTRWQSIGKTGFMHAVQCQQSFGVNPRPKTILVSVDVIYEGGGVVV
jgi:hypothetical protein